MAAFNERVTTRAREAASPDDFAYGEQFKLITEL